jgi:hypothetical protein
LRRKIERGRLSLELSHLDQARVERKLFAETMKGKRVPKEGEVERWLALQEKAREK